MGVAAVMFWATVVAAAAGAALALAAGWRWRSASRSAIARLTACRSRARGNFSHQDLAGLPPPVAHYLGRVLHEGQPLIRAARVEQEGTFFLPNGKGRWAPMEAVERFLIEDLDLNRKRRAQVVDRTAAAWILQGALDRVRDQATWI